VRSWSSTKKRRRPRGHGTTRSEGRLENALCVNQSTRESPSTALEKAPESNRPCQVRADAAALAEERVRLERELGTAEVSAALSDYSSNGVQQ
jgi:hypothetical protein